MTERIEGATLRRALFLSFFFFNNNNNNDDCLSCLSCRAG